MLEKSIESQKLSIENQQEENRAADKRKKKQDEINQELKNQNAIIDNTISKFTGLKIATGGFVDLLIEASEETGGVSKLFDQVNSRIKAVTNPVVLLATALSAVGGILNDLSNKIASPSSLFTLTIIAPAVSSPCETTKAGTPIKFSFFK